MTTSRFPANVQTSRTDVDKKEDTDPNLATAMALWRESNAQSEQALCFANSLRGSLRDSGSHRAYGWAALTCGRIHMLRGEIELAEVALTEALGRFILTQDACGEGLAICHLGLAMQKRGDLNRALEMMLVPLAAETMHSLSDICAIHNMIAGCYFKRDETHQAVPHLVKAYALSEKLNSFRVQATILGNLGALLTNFSEWELGLRLVQEAWRLETENSQPSQELRLTHLVNTVLIQLRLGRFDDALLGARSFMKLSAADAVALHSEGLIVCCFAFALSGLLAEAQDCLSKAALGSPDSSKIFQAHLNAGRAILLHMKGQTNEAIAAAKQILDQPLNEVKRAAHQTASFVLVICYTALGKKSEASKWERYGKETGREKLFASLIVSQIRAGLEIEDPIEPLTERELECLKLAARGQTSSDIGLKLAIKTRTVNFHFSKILRKFNAVNRQEAIAKASRARLLNGP